MNFIVPPGRYLQFGKVMTTYGNNVFYYNGKKNKFSGWVDKNHFDSEVETLELFSFKRYTTLL